MGRFFYYIWFAMSANKPYPSILQGIILATVTILIFELSFILLARIITEQYSIDIKQDDFNRDVYTLVLYTVVIGATILYARSNRIKSRLNSPTRFKLFPTSIFFLGAIVILCSGIILELFFYYVPPSKTYIALMEERLGGGLFSIITTIIIAPILEEILMRGIILDGFLKRYNPSKAIIWSAIIFGLFHLNPWQGGTGIVIGLLLGWLYWKTGSLWLCITLHAFNNLIAVLFGTIADIDSMTLVEYLGLGKYTVAFVTALIILIGCLRYLHRHFRSQQVESIEITGELPM